MASFNPIPAYVIGVACLGLGIHSFFRPAHEYPRFGLPLEPASLTSRQQTDDKTLKQSGSVSPLIYIKAIRESTYGLALIALQYHEQDLGVTAMLAVLSLAGLGDGLIVWNYGGDQLRTKAFGHWITFVGLGGWSLWRTFLA